MDLLILLMAPYGRAIQHYIEGYVGKKFAIVFTLFIVLCGISIFYDTFSSNRPGASDDCCSSASSADSTPGV